MWKLISRLKPATKGSHRRPAFRPRLEPLEDRLAPATFTWTGALSTLWSDPGNWAESRTPTASDPERDDLLFFPSTGRLDSVNDIGTVSTAQIRIDGNNYNISGGTVRLDTNAPSTVSALFLQGNNGTLSSNLVLLTRAADMRFEVAGGNQFTLSGIISGAGGFRKLGDGTLVLDPDALEHVDNVYTGTTSVERGVLEIRSDGALGPFAPTTVSGTGTLRLGSGSNFGTEPLTLSGTGGIANRGALSVIENLAIWNGDITLASTEVVVRVDDVLLLDCRVRGDGGLSKVGTGTLSFLGDQSNDYTGTTRVTEGSLNLIKSTGSAITGPLIIGDGIGAAGSDRVFLGNHDQISDLSTVTVTVTGELNLATRNDTIGALIVNGGILGSDSLSPGTLTLNGTVTATSVTLGGQSLPATIQGRLHLTAGGIGRAFHVSDGPAEIDLNVTARVSRDASFGLIKLGAGRMRLAADNIYAGETSVEGGTLQIDGNQGQSRTVVHNDGTLAGTGTMNGLIVNVGGTVRPGAGQSLTVNGDAGFGALSTFSTDLVASSAGTLGATGTLALTSSSGISPRLEVRDINNPTRPDLLPPLGAPIPILGAATIAGQFRGLPNNAIAVSVSGLSYRVNYTPNNVFVTRINGPMLPQRAITSPIDEGGIATLTGRLATILPDDTFFLEVNWGDGSRTETFRFRPGDPRDVVLPHRYLDNGTYTVGLLWRDQRGSFNTGTLAVTVRNVAPSVNAGSDALVAAGSMFVRNGSFTDPGADTWTATVNYGDGAGVQPLALNPAQRFMLQHRYQTPGVYTVTVTVRDDDGGVGVDTFVVRVQERGGGRFSGIDANVLDQPFGEDEGLRRPRLRWLKAVRGV